MTGPNPIRELLDTALNDEPAHTVDPATLIKRGRRRIQTRRAIGAAAVTALATLVLVGATLLHPLLADRHVRTAATAPTIATTANPGPTPDHTTVTNTRLNQLITTLLREDGVADMRVIAGSTTFTNHGTTATLNATLADGRGTGTLTVTRMTTSHPADQLCPTPTTCTHTRYAGRDVLTYTEVVIPPTGISTFAVAQQGHVRVIAASANVTPQATTWTRPSPPLTGDQLANIAARVVDLAHP